MSETATNTDTRSAIDTQTMKWVCGIISLVGLWIAVSPFVFEATAAALWNNVIVGVAIFLLAGFNYYRMTNGLLASVGVGSLVVLLGLWSIIAPFLFAMGSDELAWSTLIAGIGVAALSGYNTYANRKADTPATGTRA
ncbi:SPW repeat protein [Halohasta litorea]|uniref:SPW repeat protein n=1 Tax=Halohasta litorea TaxID=869891 RepID=A0ABD6D8V9_9EURY|nr:SPW repeat protein [Halohasta litorea]